MYNYIGIIRMQLIVDVVLYYSHVYIQKEATSIGSMRYGARLIPFQVSVSLAGDQLTDLEYDVKIDGVEPNCITVKLPSKYIGIY